MCQDASTRKAAFARVSLVLPAVLLTVFLNASAQQLSLNHFDVHNGLAHSLVTCIYQDRKGYLWFGTFEGLSRFDGYDFVNYAASDGLPNALISAIAEDRAGRLWVGTPAGVGRLIDEPTEESTQLSSSRSPTERKKFIGYRVGGSIDANNVDRMAFDDENNLWCLTEGGIYAAQLSSTGEPAFKAVRPIDHRPRSEGAAFNDRKGRLWLGMLGELILIDHGQAINKGAPSGVDGQERMNISEDTQGDLLVSYDFGLYRFLDSVANGGAGWQQLSLSLGPQQVISSLAGDPDGSVWIGTTAGLIKYREGEQDAFSSSHGLPSGDIVALAFDRDGDLWIATSAGVSKLSNELIVTFPSELPNQSIARIVESLNRRIYVSINGGGLGEVANGKIIPIEGSQKPPFNNIGKCIIQDRRGDWWIGTDIGLFRFRGPDLNVSHGQKFTIRDGIPEQALFNGGLYEAPDGKIWVSILKGDLYYFDPSRTGDPRFEPVSLKGLTVPEGLQPDGLLQMKSDRSGTLWLASFGFLGRMVEGRTETITTAENLPSRPDPRAFFQDSRGWFWIGLRYDGVVMSTDPSAKTLRFTSYSSGAGLASNAVWAIAEDRYGRIYLGTGRALDQLDPTKGVIRHYNTNDGLAGNLITDLVVDSHGDLWVGTTGGLSRLHPQTGEEMVPPPIYLSHIRIGGENLPLPECGVAKLADLSLSAGQNNLVIQYAALSFASAGAVHYEYKLEGIDTGWSAPTVERTINYARLQPGSYKFVVRASIPGARQPSDPASFSFRIMPPVWQRWWFVLLGAACLTIGITLLYRFRVRQLLRMERIRRQIAIDLHDDMGSGLSQVTILSELVKRKSAPEEAESLSEIASLARAMRESMADIVWAVDPRKDRLADLVQRMKQVAFNLLEAEGVQVEFTAPPDDEIARIGLEPDRRRHLLLIFKETLTNIARHARATEVEVEMRIEARKLYLSIRDNGCGFNPDQEYDGRGLRSLKHRTSELAAHLRIVSAQGSGTMVVIDIPLE